ncbi:hypothetical protein [Herpetosiphon giganteus]|uniref:hypothetical protein n=1 Tax=Herpetosiphon giganteus TaxID=2029754 RepID=UPI00195EC5C8|nr:hypothetical protein [Herpetosiphon giganteus]MBM7842917.1 hypothetical protein [Herpetosiphon giganteus]
MQKSWRNPQTWTIEYFLLCLTGLLLITISLLIPIQSDTWWLLRIGQDVIHNQLIPTTDIYSHSIFGADWPNHEWLSATLFYLLFYLGKAPLLIVGSGLITIATWYILAKTTNYTTIWHACIFMLAIIISMGSWSIRPQILSILGIVITMYLLDHPKNMIYYPILFLVWANLHAGVASGGIILVAALLVSLVKYRHLLTRFIIINLICGLITLVNPLGYKLWLYIAGSLGNTAHKYISEWQPFDFSKPQDYLLLVWLGIFGFTVWKNKQLFNNHKQLTIIAASIIFAILAFKSMRNTAFFVIISLPLVINSLPNKPSTSINKHNGKFYQFLFVGMSIVAIIVILLQNQTPTITQAEINALNTCQGNLYNTYDDGGELIWFVPQKPVIIDNRSDPYSEELFLEVSLAEEQGIYQALFTKYQINCVYIAKSSPLAANLQKDNWKLLHNGQTHAVYTR